MITGDLPSEESSTRTSLCAPLCKFSKHQKSINRGLKGRGARLIDRHAETSNKSAAAVTYSGVNDGPLHRILLPQPR